MAFDYIQMIFALVKKLGNKSINSHSNELKKLYYVEILGELLSLNQGIITQKK